VPACARWFSRSRCEGFVQLTAVDERFGVWDSTGLTGTLDVVDAKDGALDVVWSDVSLSSSVGFVFSESDSGWIHCAPE
jgi:hypothetical protein